MSDQVKRVLMSLRDEIATGKLQPGARLVEAQLSERLGVSRTPVRPALRLLAAEGLLEPAGARGFRVKKVDEDRIRIAILMRGVVEGFAAREIALKGIDREPLKKLQHCLSEGDRILADGTMTEDKALEYIQMNALFHATIRSACGSALVGTFLDQCANVPFAGTSYLAYDRQNAAAEHLRFAISHSQHHAIVSAIVERDTGRAETLMREHANNSLGYVGLLGHDAPASPYITILPRTHGLRG